MIDSASPDWDPSMRFGDAGVDADHRHVLGILARFQALWGQDKATDALHDTYHELMAYAFDHFTVEEAFLQNKAYPELQAHREAHRRILLDLTDMAEELMQPGVQAGALARRIHALVLDHVQGPDRDCARYLQQLGPLH